MFQLSLTAAIQNYIFENTATSPRGQWVNNMIPRHNCVKWVGSPCDPVYYTTSWHPAKQLESIFCHLEWQNNFQLGQNGNFKEYTATVLNTLRPRQNGRHFTDDTFKRIFLNDNVGISIKISLKFVHKGPMNNIPALVQMMAWRRPGDKSLSEPMVVRLPTHICVTWPQWVNSLWPMVQWCHRSGQI